MTFIKNMNLCKNVLKQAGNFILVIRQNYQQASIINKNLGWIFFFLFPKAYFSTSTCVQLEVDVNMWFYVGINFVASASNSQYFLSRSPVPMMVFRVNLFMKAGWKRTLHLKIRTFLGKLLVCIFSTTGQIMNSPLPLVFPRHAMLRCLINNLSQDNPTGSLCAAFAVLISQNSQVF